MQQPSLSFTSLQTTPTLTLEQEEVLRGISPQSWAAYSLLKWPLATGEVNKNFQRVVDTLLYPLPGAESPIDVRLVVVDLGKRAYKFVCLDKQSQYVSLTIPDAYAAITTTMQQDSEHFGSPPKDDDAVLYSYRVKEQEKPGVKRSTELFEMGSNPDAIRRADVLQTDEDTKVRVGDPRSRNMIFAGLAESYAKMAMSPDDEHKIILCVGVPPRDLETEEITNETNKAIVSLKGSVAVEQQDLRSEIKVEWKFDIIGVYVEVQTKGTFYCIAKQLNGDPAVPQTLFKIFDIGGGDTNVVEVNASGRIMSRGERLGFGTVEIARALMKLVYKRYGIELTEIAAQQALIDKKIMRNGAQQDISPLIEELRPRFAQILTRVTVSRDSLSTYIIFTGGGSALIEAEIIDMMKNKNENLVLGTDYIIIPTLLAPLCNAIGLYASTYLKISALIKRTIITYCEIGDQLEAAQQELDAVQQLAPNAVLPTEKQRRENAAAKKVRQFHDQYVAHIGGKYPVSLIKSINAQRKAAARQQAKAR